MHYPFVPLPSRGPLRLARRQAPCADRHRQSRVLGPAEGNARALLRRRPAHPARHAARQHPRLPELVLARIRPARRRVAAVRRLLGGGRARELHHERQDGAGAPRGDRRRAGARLRAHPPQLRAGRAALPPPAQAGRGAPRHRRDAARLRGRSTGRKAKGWLSSSLRGTTNTPQSSPRTASSSGAT